MSHITNNQQTDASPLGMTELTTQQVEQWQSEFDSSPTLQLSQLVLTNASPATTLVSRQRLIQDQHVFNLELQGVGAKDDKKGTYPGPVTDQKSSGRCWLFALLNCLRYRIVPALNLGDFQFSQAYVYFYDKFEKANFFLEQMIDTADEPMDSRLFAYLNTDPVNDGGQFDMAVNIVEKYGLVPQEIYPESYSSSASWELNKIVTRKLREFGLELRAILADSADDLSKEQALEKARQRKIEMIQTIFNILCCTLGTPPRPDAEFTWEAYDKDRKFFTITSTPKKFYAEHSASHSPATWFSLINDPRNDYDKLYTVDRLGNVVGGRPVRCKWGCMLSIQSPDLPHAV